MHMCVCGGGGGGVGVEPTVFLCFKNVYVTFYVKFIH